MFHFTLHVDGGDILDQAAVLVGYVLEEVVWDWGFKEKKISLNYFVLNVYIQETLICLHGEGRPMPSVLHRGHGRVPKVTGQRISGQFSQLAE